MLNIPGCREAVETEKAAALKRILIWMMCDKEGIANVKKIKTLIESLTGNCPAMIRACDKNDFHMVSYFLDFQMQLETVKVGFKIREPKFKDEMSKSEQKVSHSAYTTIIL